MTVAYSGLLCETRAFFNLDGDSSEDGGLDGLWKNEDRCQRRVRSEQWKGTLYRAAQGDPRLPESGQKLGFRARLLRTDSSEASPNRIDHFVELVCVCQHMSQFRAGARVDRSNVADELFEHPWDSIFAHDIEKPLTIHVTPIAIFKLVGDAGLETFEPAESLLDVSVDHRRLGRGQLSVSPTLPFSGTPMHVEHAEESGHRSDRRECRPAESEVQVETIGYCCASENPNAEGDHGHRAPFARLHIHALHSLSPSAQHRAGRHCWQQVPA